jgi:hypothetical protein
VGRPRFGRRRHGSEVLALASARVLAVRAALLGIVLASGACFRPKIASGGFKCDTTKGAKSCPDDFVCDLATLLCVTATTDGGAGKGGSGGGGGKGGTGGGGGQAVDASPDVPCLPTVPSCQTSDAGLCDPVCNAGCGQCYEKCSSTTTAASNGAFLSGTLVCNPLKLSPPGSTPVGILNSCNQDSPGSARQEDNCAPGTVCLVLECAPRCYQYCRSSGDCANGASCTRDAGGGLSVCDVPPATCDPTFNQSACSPASLAMGCYLGSDTKQTLCDCPYGDPQGGGLGTGDICAHSRQCGIGHVCFDYTGRGAPPVCLVVCRLPGDGGANTSCPGGLPCSPFSTASGANKIYGYCQIN